VTERIPPAILAVDDAALHLIDLALEEDRGAGDWTTRWTVPARTKRAGTIIAKADGVIAGVALAAAVFLRLDPRSRLRGAGRRRRNGETRRPVVRVSGPGRAILTGERVALNFLQHLSGVATLTRRFVDAVDGTRTPAYSTPARPHPAGVPSRRPPSGPAAATTTAPVSTTWS
jgi:nicotinate-nucleotide pyrophosphorylase